MLNIGYISINPASSPGSYFTVTLTSENGNLGNPVYLYSGTTTVSLTCTIGSGQYVYVEIAAVTNSSAGVTVGDVHLYAKKAGATITYRNLSP